MKKFVKNIAASLSLASMTLMGIVSFYSSSLPDSYYVENENLSLSSVFSISSKPCKDKSSYASTYSDYNNNIEDAVSSVTKISDSTLMLFDSVPIKNVKEKTIERPMLIPSGKPFGIKLMTDGVVVVKMESSSASCPAAECGIRVGDIIVSINGEKVDSNQKISDIISSSKGQPCEVIYKHDGEQKTTTLSPAIIEGGYKAGMWVRDSSAGIGTLTFYDPQTTAFGGLGHPICDSDTKLPLPLSKGTVGDVKIKGCDKSEQGNPGQLLGEFTSKGNVGSILSNCNCGIFGKLDDYNGTKKSVPMAFKHEIHTGKATIYTTIDGNEPKEYSVEIEKVNLSKDNEHDMVIKITDEELINTTGGIVQGLSGSPIIQGGRLVGAVTHVFIDNPEEGYGVFAETMYENACKLNNNDLSLAG